MSNKKNGQKATYTGEARDYGKYKVEPNASGVVIKSIADSRFWLFYPTAWDGYCFTCHETQFKIHNS